MSTRSKTVAFDLPDSSYLEVTAAERDDTSPTWNGFSITGHLWEMRGLMPGRSRKRLGHEMDRAGMLPENISYIVPWLKPLVDVHGTDLHGVPMHALSNGWYLYSGAAATWERHQISIGRGAGYERLLAEDDHTRAAGALHIAPTDLPEGLDGEGFAAFVKSLAAHYDARAQTARQVLDLMSDGDNVA